MTKLLHIRTRSRHTELTYLTVFSIFWLILALASVGLSFLIKTQGYIIK